MPLAHRLDSDLIEQLYACPRCVDRRDSRSAVFEPPRALAGPEVFDVEGERIRDAPPADSRGLGALSDLAAGIKKRDARPSHEPLQRAADEVVDPADVDIEGERADRLIRVNHKGRALAVTDLGEPLDILSPAAREVHVTRADGRGTFIDGALEELERNAHAVGAAHKLDLRTSWGHRKERVTVRGEVEVRDHDLGPLRVVERARDADEARRRRGEVGEHAGDVPAARETIAHCG